MKFLVFLAVAFLAGLAIRWNNNRLHAAPLATLSGVGLTEEEKELLASLGMEDSVGLAVKQIANAPLQGLYLRNEFNDDAGPELRGIRARIDEERKQDAARLAQKGTAGGYQFFSCGWHGEDEYSYLAAIKSGDRYDVLRVVETNGINYDIETGHIIEFLKKWEQTTRFRILEADFDYIVLEFEDMLFDVAKFAKEAFGFCPDFNAAFNDHKELKKYIEQNRVVDFWWD